MRSDHGCAYGSEDCDKPDWRCQPAELCPKAGVRVYRDKFTQGGHHHLNKKEIADDSRQPAR